eukprot:TRINITY_DN3055_c0_g1_i1.p4 TRINITY_DN3055_c0_g1~~TRINITY_DN3055_c0_g1_i1.p4  ORF type:complete len:102 (+),score=25.50 TRINITY_DN3055_c0_g1_i1:609-914(+)
MENSHDAAGDVQALCDIITAHPLWDERETKSLYTPWSYYMDRAIGIKMLRARAGPLRDVYAAIGDAGDLADGDASDVEDVNEEEISALHEQQVTDGGRRGV